MKNIQNIAFVLSCLFSISVTAQNTLNEDTFIVVSEFQPILTDAVKIKDNPDLTDTAKMDIEVKYSTLKKTIQTRLDVENIKPARIKGEPLVRLYKHYVKLGIGLYTTPLAEYRFMSKRNKKWMYDFAVNHLSSKGLNKINYAGFSDNSAQLFVKRADKKFAYTNTLYFRRNVVHYYGLPADANISITDKDTVKQRYNIVGYKGSYTHYEKDTGEIAYTVTAGGYYLQDIAGANEMNIVVGGSGGQFTGAEWYRLNALFDYYKPQNAADSTGNGILALEPQISTIAKKWRLNVGIGIYVDADNTARFHFYPQAEFKYNVVGDIVIPYVGINGKIKRNSIRTLFEQNRFITPDVELLNTNNKIRLYAGIRGQISKRVSFNFRGNKQTDENFPLFVIDTAAAMQNKFTVVYDKITSTRYSVQIAYENRDKLKILLNAVYADYSAFNEIKAWNLPALEAKLSVNYNLRKKIIAHATLFYVGKRYGRIIETIATLNGNQTLFSAQTLNAYLDANIGFEYCYTKRLSAYINFNNIAASQYYKWQQYKVQGFGILGGISYSF